MSNEQKKVDIKKKEEIAEPLDAKIVFHIPAYKDKSTGDPFQRSLTMPTRNAYAIYMKLKEKQFIK